MISGTSIGALLWLAAASPGGPSTAPLGVRTQGTLRDLFLDVTLADARAAEGSELDLRWSVANDWTTPTLLSRGGREVVLQTDEQADALGISLRLPWQEVLGRSAAAAERPFAARVWTAVEVRLTQHWGGWSDRPIERWHDLIGSINFARQAYPRNAVSAALAEPGGATLFSLHAPRLALGDVAVRTQLLLADGGTSFRGDGVRRALSARLDVKLPLGRLDRLGGSGGTDAGVGLLGTSELAPWLTAHAMMALSVWSGLPDFPLQPRRWHGTFEISLAATAGGWVFLLEDRLLTPAFEPGWHVVSPEGAFGLVASAAFGALRPHNQVTLGVRRGAFTAWLSEDFTPGPDFDGGWFYDSNAPDLALGVAWRLGW